MAKRGRRKKFKLSFNINPESLRSLLAVGLLIFSIITLISFIAPNYFINAKIQLVFRKVFGYSSIIIPFITGMSGLLLIDSIKHRIKDFRIVLGLFSLLVAVSGFLHVFIDVEQAQEVSMAGKGGGFVGYMIATNLKNMVSVFGAVAILAGLFVISVILIFNVSIDQAVSFYRENLITGDILKRKKKGEEDIEITEGMVGMNEEGLFDDRTGETGFDGEEGKAVSEEASFKIVPSMSEPQIIVGSLPMDSDGSLVSIAPNLPYTNTKVWKLPGLDLLDDPTGGPPDTGDVESNKKIIKDTLSSFGIPAEIVDVQIGPSVTKYALDTPPGIKIAKVSNLQYDLALALASPTGSVRVEAPIPGKALIGIEVPNKVRERVDFKSMITSDQIKASKSKLTIVLGKDVGGVVNIYDIGRMPHMLIAGATGSGKSVFIHNLIFSLLFRATPQEVKLIMMDFKRGVELNVYEDLPHLYTPLVTVIEKAPSVFKWAESEMMRRFKLFESAKAKNIEVYNQKSGFQALPYIVIIVDEMADIMVMDPTSVEKSIIRLAQLARATGIHLVLTVQRPSAEVLTGLIKANIPCRIAFNVTRLVDSRVIIDQAGAEKLLGQGDMLFIPPDKPNPVRLQGAFVSDAEKINLVNFLKNQGIPPEYKEEILEMPTDQDRARSVAAGGASVDEKYHEAIEIVVSAGKASASLLQRRLSIGYARAARILDELEKNNIVGPPQGSKPREVLIDSISLEDDPSIGDIKKPRTLSDEEDY